MAQWYLGKIAYQLEQENGAMKAIVEVYLIEAVSFTDGEAILYSIAEELKIGTWSIKTLNPVKLSDIFTHSDGEHWYMAKVVYLSLNETSGKETRVVNQVLVNATGIAQAVERIDISLKNILIPYDIEAVRLTPILEVHATENES